MIYIIPFPLGYNDYKINYLEMVNVMVALKLLGRCWAIQCKYVQILSDNLPVVEVIRTGRAKDQILASFVRYIWLLTTMYNIQLVVSHIVGQNNTFVDLLSRWHQTPNNEQKLAALLPIHQWIPAHINLMLFNTQI